MESTPSKTTCPNCGNSFEPPVGVAHCFCTKCGTRIELQAAPDAAESTTPNPSQPTASSEPPTDQTGLSDQVARLKADGAAFAAELAKRAVDAATDPQQLPQNVREKYTRAEELTLAAVQQAIDLAATNAKPADIQAAITGAYLAMDALRQSQMSQQILKDAQATAAAAAESARMAAATQARISEETDAMLRESAERRQREKDEERARQDSERAQREAEARARAEQEAAARRQAEAQAQAAQAQAAQARPLEYRRNVTVRSNGGNCGLFTITLPTTWNIDEALLCRGTSGSRPYNAYVSFSDGVGAGMTLTLGDAGVRNSAGMNAMMAQYGGAIAGVDRTHYGQLPEPRSVSDEYAKQVVAGLGGTNLGCVFELGSDDLAKRQQEAKAVFAKAAEGTPAVLRDPFASEMTRIYMYSLNNMTFKMAVYVRTYAMKDGSGVDMMSPVGLMFGLGEALGARSKAKKAEKQAKRDAGGHPSDDSTAKSDGKPICLPRFLDYTGTGTIYWDVAGIATVYAPTDRFDKAYREAFLPLVASYWPHNDILSLAAADAQQQAAAVQQATNVQIQRMNMQHQAMMAANRQVQAAADARFESWQRQSDAHHAAFRERTNAQFNSSSGSAAGDWSEAIRGVNTYTTSDGREVEIDVAADRAFENQAGDVIGWSSAQDPGSDWTELPRT